MVWLQSPLCYPVTSTERGWSCGPHGEAEVCSLAGLGRFRASPPSEARRNKAQGFISIS